MRTVQRRRGALPTLLAALLVLAVLTLPRDLEDARPAAILRLPLEGLVLLGVLALLPPERPRLRRSVAGAAGVLLGLVAVLRLLDLAFLEALDRPFDPLIDWRYAGSLAGLVRDSVGVVAGIAMLVAAVAVAVVLLVLLPLAVLRLAGATAQHRRGAARSAVALGVVWAMAAGSLGTGVGGLASRDAWAYLYGQVARIPGELRDQREFAAAAEGDPFAQVPAADLLVRLRDKDVLLVFVESLGRVAVDGAGMSPVARALDSGVARLERAGYSSRSAWLTSPTFGGISWLAHATLQSGLWVDSQARYDVLMTSRRLTLSRLFSRAGWRTVAVVPANDRAWPQGEFYGFDEVYDSRHLGYGGPRFGYAKVPDQVTLDAFQRLERASASRRPVMAEVDLVSSHAPWAPTPRLVDPAVVRDDAVFEEMVREVPSEEEVWPAPERVRRAYAESIAYSVTALVDYVVTHGRGDLVVVLVGDHQPASVVSGHGAGHDVPVALLVPETRLLDGVAGWGWQDGLRPGPESPVWRMDDFRDRFLAAYGPRPHSGSSRVTP